MCTLSRGQPFQRWSADSPKHRHLQQPSHHFAALTSLCGRPLSQAIHPLCQCCSTKASWQAGAVVPCRPCHIQVGPLGALSDELLQEQGSSDGTSPATCSNSSTAQHSRGQQSAVQRRDGTPQLLRMRCREPSQDGGRGLQQLTRIPTCSCPVKARHPWSLPLRLVGSVSYMCICTHTDVPMHTCVVLEVCYG
jgi:hypothetical protein